jgi:hypothetical protein
VTHHLKDLSISLPNSGSIFQCTFEVDIISSQVASLFVRFNTSRFIFMVICKITGFRFTLPTLNHEDLRNRITRVIIRNILECAYGISK